MNPECTAHTDPPESRRELTMQLWQRYNESGDPRLRDRLVLTYSPVVSFIVDAIVSRDPEADRDALHSAGLHALVTALDAYRQNDETMLRQFVWTEVRAALTGRPRLSVQPRTSRSRGARGHARLGRRPAARR